MSKTLVIAEKPSVGRDLAATLPGTFKQSQDKTHLVDGDYVITWAVGHLVGLAEPDQYDDKLKKWRFADLPIVPTKFKLIPNDDKAKKQLSAVHKLMKDKDVEVIVNACDAGREGELIFAYLYETSGVKKPVKRLWLNSMTKTAIRDAFEDLRDGQEMRLLEEAARSRSEADWLVGMNATRAASIRLRAAFDGAVSLGRVQTPTLALVARRELEIRAFVPEPYWLVEARFAASGERLYSGRYLGGKRIKEDEATAIVADVSGRPGTITKLEKKEEREAPQLLYDLTSLQRHANTLFGFSARRTLAAAQRLYEEHKAITYPRTNSRFLTSDMIGEIKPTAAHVGRHERYGQAASYVTRLEKLPLGRVVNDKRVEDHHAVIPTRSDHDLTKMGPDESRIYDLVAKRFLAVFHPDAVYERTRIETTVTEHVFRTSGRVLVEAGWKGVYGEEAQKPGDEDDSGGDQLLPRLEQGEEVETRSVESLRKETQPPRRFTEASLLGAMETAGKDIEDAELREAMKDSGIGTPATRASIIERLIQVGYLEREGRALHATEKGVSGDLAPRRAPADLTGADRELGASPGSHRAGRGHAARLHVRHRQVHDRHGRRARQAQGRQDRAGQPRAVPDLRPRRDREPQGLLVLVEGRSGVRLRHLEEEGEQDPARSRWSRSSWRPARPRSRSLAFAAARVGRSAPSSPWNRARTASGGSSSTRNGRRTPRAQPESDSADENGDRQSETANTSARAAS